MINDYEGYNVGDHVLIKFVELINKEIITKECVIGIGGDEFLIIFYPDKDADKLDELISEFRKTFKIYFKYFNYLSFSYGLNEITKEFTETIDLLDEKLYLDKKNNKIVLTSFY